MKDDPWHTNAALLDPWRFKADSMQPMSSLVFDAANAATSGSFSISDQDKRAVYIATQLVQAIPNTWSRQGQAACLSALYHCVSKSAVGAHGGHGIPAHVAERDKLAEVHPIVATSQLLQDTMSISEQKRYPTLAKAYQDCRHKLSKPVAREVRKLAGAATSIKHDGALVNHSIISQVKEELNDQTVVKVTEVSQMETVEKVEPAPQVSVEMVNCEVPGIILQKVEASGNLGDWTPLVGSQALTRTVDRRPEPNVSDSGVQTDRDVLDADDTMDYMKRKFVELRQQIEDQHIKAAVQCVAKIVSEQLGKAIEVQELEIQAMAKQMLGETLGTILEDDENEAG